MPSPSSSPRRRERARPARAATGEDGESAYEIAVRNGFRGTEKEWLASLRHGERGERGERGEKGDPGQRGDPGEPGREGLAGRTGAPGAVGERGEPGDNGWTPTFAVVPDGDRRVLQVVRWVGGSGPRPEDLLYVGPNGFVARIDEATDIRGPKGDRGVGSAVAVGGGVSMAQVLALVEGMVMEDFDQVPIDDQTNSAGTPEVLVFTFSADVHKVWVKLLATSISDASTGRVRVDGVDPDANTGHPIDAGVPQPIAAVTSEVRVYTPAGKTVNVTGYRRRA